MAYSTEERIHVVLVRVLSLHSAPNLKAYHPRTLFSHSYPPSPLTS